MRLYETPPPNLVPQSDETAPLVEPTLTRFGRKYTVRDQQREHSFSLLCLTLTITRAPRRVAVLDHSQSSVAYQQDFPFLERKSNRLRQQQWHAFKEPSSKMAFLTALASSLGETILYRAPFATVQFKVYQGHETQRSFLVLCKALTFLNQESSIQRWTNLLQDTTLRFYSIPDAYDSKGRAYPIEVIEGVVRLRLNRCPEMGSLDQHFDSVADYRPEDRQLFF